MNDEYIIVDTLYEFLGARGHRVLDLHYNFDISYNSHKLVAVVDSNQYLWFYIGVFDWMEFDALLSDGEFGVMLGRLLLYQNMGDDHES